MRQRFWNSNSNVSAFLARGTRSRHIVWLSIVFWLLCHAAAYLCPTDFTDPSKTVIFTTANYEMRASGPSLRTYARLSNGTVYEAAYLEVSLLTWSVIEGNDDPGPNTVYFIPEQDFRNVSCNITTEVIYQEDYTTPGRIVETDRIWTRFYFNGGVWEIWSDSHRENLPLRLPRGNPDHPSGVNLTALASQVKLSFLMRNMTYQRSDHWIYTRIQLLVVGAVDLSNIPPSRVTFLDPSRPDITQVITQDFYFDQINATFSVEQFIFVDYQLLQARLIPPGQTGRIFLAPTFIGGEYLGLWQFHNISIEWDPTLALLFLGEVTFAAPQTKGLNLLSQPSQEASVVDTSNAMVIGSSVGSALAALAIIGAISAIIWYKRFGKVQDPMLPWANQLGDGQKDDPNLDEKNDNDTQGFASGSGASAVLQGVLDLTPIPSHEITFLYQLGKGSQGSVFLANWNGTMCAVKNLSSMHDPSVLLKEASLMNSLPQHRSLVGFLGVCIEAGRYAIITEFCPRGDLLSYINSLNSERDENVDYETWKLLFGIAEGMKVLSQFNIVHRDLACRNILLDEYGFPKIADFGYSRRVDAIEKQGQTAAIVGPIRWMSVENIRDQIYSEKSDVWSFGATIVEIFTRQRPYISFKKDVVTLGLDIRSGALNPRMDPLTDLCCPPAIISLLDRCFQQDPDKRPSFDTICSELESQYPAYHAKYCLELDEATATGELRQSHAPSTESNHRVLSSKHSLNEGSRSLTLNHDLSSLELRTRLGSGSYGEVFLGQLGKEFVAVKKLKATGSMEVSSAVFREATVAASLPPHRNVISMYGLKQDGASTWIVMEFAARGNLEEFISKAHKNGAIPEMLFFRICLGIARGMRHLAEHKVIHRDLAARNVLLDSNLEPKVADFGMSRVISEADDSGVTASDAGPVRWFAPECLLYHNYSEKSDVWAFGCTVFEIAFGKYPFPALDLMATANEVGRNGNNPLSPGFGAEELIAKLQTPKWMVDLMRLCFHHNPKDRPDFYSIIEYLVDEAPRGVVKAERDRERVIEAKKALLLAMDDIAL